MRPIAMKIDSESKKISYMCAKCAASFELIDKSASCCYNCGEKIDWENLPIVLNESDDKLLKDYIFHQKILNEINKH